MKAVLQMAVVMGLLTGWAMPAAAGGARPDAGGDVTFTMAASLGESTLVAQAKGIVFEKRLTRDSVSIRVRAGGDAFVLEADRSGVTRLARRGKMRVFKPGDKPEERLRKVQALLAGSTALLALEGLAGHLESNERPDAQSVLMSYALVQALRGSSSPARALARRASARAKDPVTRVAFEAPAGENILACWAEYSHAVTVFSYQYEVCFNNWWWNPISQGACAFQFVLQSELAFFSVIACAGGLPV